MESAKRDGGRAGVVGGKAADVGEGGKARACADAYKHAEQAHNELLRYMRARMHTNMRNNHTMSYCFQGAWPGLSQHLEAKIPAAKHS